jgi:hypothetical protein
MPVFTMDFIGVLILMVAFAFGVGFLLGYAAGFYSPGSSRR